MTNKVPVVPPKSKEHIEQEVRLFLARTQPDALSSSLPVDVETIFEIDLPQCLPGLRTGYTDLLHIGANVMGFTDAGRKISLVDKTLYESDTPVAQRRFRATVAHEVAHCVLHLPILNFQSTTSLKYCELYRADRNSIKPYVDPEWQAWKFAGALLMPKERILELFSQGWNEHQLAEHFDVNPAFVRARIGSLKK